MSATIDSIPRHAPACQPSPLPAHLRELLRALARLSRNRHGLCYAGNAHFAAEYGVHPVTVSRWIAALIEGGWVAVERFDGRLRFLKVLRQPYQRCEAPRACVTTQATLPNETTATPPPAPNPAPPAVAHDEDACGETSQKRGRFQAPVFSNACGTPEVAPQVIPEVADVLRGLEAAGMDPPTARRLAAADPHQCRLALDALKARRDVERPGGWLRRCIEQGWPLEARTGAEPARVHRMPLAALEGPKTGVKPWVAAKLARVLGQKE